MDEQILQKEEGFERQNELTISRTQTKPLKRILEMEKVKKILQVLPLSTILLVAFIIRLFSALESEGLIHPDEVFQSLEMIHFRIFGKYGTGQTIPWEFNEDYPFGGARSWFFVLILALLYRFIMLFGVTDPLALILSARLLLSLLSISTVIVAYFFGRDLFNKKVGLISAFLCATWWFFPFWASRTMTDSLSSDLLFISIYLSYKAIAGENFKLRLFQGFFAGISLGTAFMLRFPSGLMGVPLFAFFLAFAIRDIKTSKKKSDKITTRKDQFYSFVPSLCFVGGSFFMVLMQGILDFFTWGDFLQSPINFFMYNIVEGNNALHGIAPWYSYFAGFYTDFANVYLFIFLTFIVMGLAFREKGMEKIFYGVIFIYWIVVFSLIPHKEFRFIFVLLPFSMIFIANGIVKFSEIFNKKKFQHIAITSILILITASSLLMTFYHKRDYWKANSGICNAMYWVGQQDDVDTVVVFENLWYTGGYAYLHQNVTTYFIRIYVWLNSYIYNSTAMRMIYSTPGTYAVVRVTDLYYIKSILISCGMVEVIILEGYPNACVYAHQ